MIASGVRHKRIGLKTRHLIRNVQAEDSWRLINLIHLTICRHGDIERPRRAMVVLTTCPMAAHMMSLPAEHVPYRGIAKW